MPSELPELDNTAIKRVITDDPPVPALIDEAVSRNDGRSGAGKDNQDLRNPWLHAYAPPFHRYAAVGWADLQASNIEVRRFRQIDGGDVQNSFESSIIGVGSPINHVPPIALEGGHCL